MAVREYGKRKYMYDFVYEEKRYRKKGFTSARAAKTAEDERKRALDDGFDITNTVPFVEFYRKWAEVRIAGVDKKTVDRYKNIGNWIEDYFKRKPINKISRLEYQTFLNWFGLEAENKHQKGVYGHGYDAVKRLNGYIRSCVRYAMFEGILQKDFTFEAKLNYAPNKSKDKNMKFLEIDELQRLKKRIMNDEEITSLMMYVAIATGGRYSDIVQMRYEDIHEAEGELFLPGTKNASASRFVPILDTDMEYIVDRIKRLPRNLNGQIFMLRGKLISNGGVNKRLKKFCAEEDTKQVTFHAFRHTYASILIAEGVSIDYIAELLGHDSPQTTTNYYRHLIHARRRKDKTLTLESMSAAVG